MYETREDLGTAHIPESDKATLVTVRGVNLGGTGGHVPPEFGVGTPMYNVPQILTCSLYFSLT